jgi:mono/diheme cytochrome c family protein
LPTSGGHAPKRDRADVVQTCRSARHGRPEGLHYFDFFRRLCVLSMLGVFSAACRQDMHDQPKFIPLRQSTFFADQRSARPLVAGTVARGQLREDTLLYTGKVNGADAAVFPFPIDDRALRRGRERFDIFCAPCHARTGEGDGMVVRRGYRRPPSYHDDRLRNAPVGHFFDVMTNGYGAMYSYAQRVSVDDRWAIAAYIRALQASQAGTVADVPADQKTALEQAPQQEATPPPGEMRPGAPPTPEGRPQGGSPENK